MLIYQSPCLELNRKTKLFEDSSSSLMHRISIRRAFIRKRFDLPRETSRIWFLAYTDSEEHRWEVKKTVRGILIGNHYPSIGEAVSWPLHRLLLRMTNEFNPFYLEFWYEAQDQIQ